METEGFAAQVCRLCGQCVRMYIDVFGEEGVKRFLGFKIHSKINILVSNVGLTDSLNLISMAIVLKKGLKKWPVLQFKEASSVVA